MKAKMRWIAKVKVNGRGVWASKVFKNTRKEAIEQAKEQMASMLAAQKAKFGLGGYPYKLTYTVESV